MKHQTDELTREDIDRLAPDHDRTSCSDENPCNGGGGWSGYYNPRTGRKDIRVPRCTRCYLLRNEGYSTDTMDFEIGIEVSLRFKR